MNTSLVRAIFVSVITASLASGCALLSKADSDAMRFFTLGVAIGRPGAPPDVAPGGRGEAAGLRLGSVTGALHLEERLVFRNSAYELGYYRELRWTERPEVCMERLLTSALFAGGRVQHLLGGAGPILDVQLLALDEILVPQHLARAQVIARLHDHHRVLWEETVTVDRPVASRLDGDLPLAAVEALDEALQAVVDQVADRVIRELAERR
ncbi:MAG: hypothetical protein ABIK09_04605 [Pseudomonadota bacterium]